MPCVIVCPPMRKASGVDKGTAAKGQSHSVSLRERLNLRAIAQIKLSTLTCSGEVTLGEAVSLRQQQRELEKG